MPINWAKSARLFFLLTLLALGGYLVAGYKSKQLPALNEILPAVKNSFPIQSETDAKPYVFSYAGKSYRIIPKAEYTITGLVVSHNNIHSFADIYHDHTSVDIKDLCLLWGDNAKSDVYQHAKFSNGSFTCYFNFKDYAKYQQFKLDQISNNHMLAQSERLRDLIRSARVGDQIVMSGHLIDYHHEKDRSFLRTTSMRREDTGNGACEVFMAESVRILKRANEFWYSLKAFLRWSAIAFLTLSAFAFVKSAYQRGPRRNA
jgi:hypothetical protein